MSRRIVFTAVIALVLATYAFFASRGTLRFATYAWNHEFNARPGLGYYASLGEGFLRGQLSMAHQPDPRLLQLEKPFHIEAREAAHAPYLWDASLFRGRYYLYFSPLPLIVFYLPFRLIAQSWPSDALAAFVFASIAFLMSAAFVRRAIGDSRRLGLWLLLIGLGNLIPFSLDDISIYEVAILAGMAASAVWAYALLRFAETPTPRAAMWVGLAVAVAIVARPHLILLLIPTIAALRWSDPASRRRLAMRMAIPLAAIGIVAAAYNVARFGSVTEFGNRYQLEYAPLPDHAPCRLCTPREAARFLNGIEHYVFWPVRVTGDFPYVELTYHRMDPLLSFRGSQEVGGILPLLPLAAIGALFAILLPTRGSSERAAIATMAGGWLIMAGLSACWWLSARYSLDYMMLIATASVVTIDRGLEWLSSIDVGTRGMRVLVTLLAVYSIVVGIFLGFRGPDNAFAQRNPELFRALADFFFIRL